MTAIEGLSQGMGKNTEAKCLKSSILSLLAIPGKLCEQHIFTN